MLHAFYNNHNIHQAKILCYVQGENSPSTSLSRNCSDINGSEFGSLDCISYSWGRILNTETNGVCNPEPYTNGLCRPQLLAWQECVVGGGAEDVLIDWTFGELSLEERERDVSQFLYFLRKFSHAYTALIH